MMSLKKQNGFSLQELRQCLRTATNFQDWYGAALALDNLSGAEAWRQNDASEFYDFLDIRARYEQLVTLLNDKNHEELLYALNEGIHGNMSGIGRPILYDRAMTGTKCLIDDYVTAIADALWVVARSPSNKISLQDKVDFFRRASHCYGRSALMLSGGAGLIYSHHGVVQTLIEQDLLPNVISGASAGAWVSGLLAMYTNEELKSGVIGDYRYDLPIHLNPLRVLAGLEPGVSPLSIKQCALDGIDNQMTFQEAYEHTGRYINISIAPAEKHQNSRLMNAITSPNVYIRSAMDASGSVPGVVPPVTLYARGADGKPKPYLPTRKWVDGSFAEDLPAKRLSRLFGVNHYIVSMINPVAVPFVDDPKLRTRRRIRTMTNTMMTDVATDLLSGLEHYLTRVGVSLISPAILMAHGVLNQSYTGDVNIILEKKNFHWRNVLFSYHGEEEIENLVLAGKRNTWPKLAMIRNATLIGQELDSILESLDQKEFGVRPSGGKRNGGARNSSEQSKGERRRLTLPSVPC
ncbi:patatin-like phospholipase family protein [Marinobacter sediminum]|uniref:patatin-like phospholipase family protein n=1 Tax=Marinobacter sediminum TaxID=256323 RepID=UPI001939E11C|nr:patatin-like phospholipase family protein [Marinobacter sediminum]